VVGVELYCYSGDWVVVVCCVVGGLVVGGRGSTQSPCRTRAQLGKRTTKKCLNAARIKPRNNGGRLSNSVLTGRLTEVPPF